MESARARRRSVVGLIAVWLGAFGACVPDIDSDESVLLSTRVLAVRAEPAEVAPGSTVRWTALVAGPDGTIAEASLVWDLCLRRPPLSQPGSVDAACIAGEGSALVTAGEGVALDATLPIDVCSRFGPDPPPVEPDQPAGRPAEPDITGGYQQPLVIRAATEGEGPVVWEQRIQCALAGAVPEDAIRYRRQYRPNRNPRLTRLVVRREDGSTIEAAGRTEPVVVNRGEALEILLGWPACPDEAVCGDGICLPSEIAEECPDECTTPVGCEGSETYLYYDGATQTFSDRREALRFSWLATVPGFELERTGVSGDAAATTVSAANRFAVPETAGDVTIWVVVRDERGGASWQELALQVE